MTDPVPARALPVGPDGAHDQTETRTEWAVREDGDGDIVPAASEMSARILADREPGNQLLCRKVQTVTTAWCVVVPDYVPGENPNVGKLSGGGFWASFCDNDECSILGCPGDCRSERS